MPLLTEPTPPSLRRAKMSSQARRSEAKAADRLLDRRCYKDSAPTELFFQSSADGLAYNTGSDI
jgi:hypothetical protein